jgi:polygalacturonase
MNKYYHRTLQIARKKAYPVLLGIITFVILIYSCNHTTGIYNILDFGAKGDNKSLNTKAINTAINACNKNGGGVVVIPAGKFVSGSIQLLSNVSLKLETGSALIGSTDIKQYFTSDKPIFNEDYSSYGLIYAVDAVNITIEGSGEIIGNGTSFMSPNDKPHIGGDFERKYTRQGESFMPEGNTFEDGPVLCPNRPNVLVLFERCENIHIRDISLKDSPFWTVRIGNCDNAVITGISILNNMLIPNSDGIHCTDSRNVRISDCNIVAGDDAIIVSGLGNEPAPGDSAFRVDSKKIGNKTGIAENVTVTNCILSSRSAGIRIGYGKRPIRNCVFSNLVIYGSNRGIGIFAREKSSIDNILFQNIIMHTRLHSGHWWGKGEPIHISAVPNIKGGNSGKITNIQFSDIIAYAETGILIYGNSESIIDNISLNRVKLSINRGKFSDSYGGNFDLRPAQPLSVALFKHEIPGLYARYVRNLTIEGFELNWGKNLPEYFTNGIEVANFDGLCINNFKGTAALKKNGFVAIKLADGVNESISFTDNSTGNTVIKARVK